mgnify:CR=1 FL=1
MSRLQSLTDRIYEEADGKLEKFLTEATRAFVDAISGDVLYTYKRTNEADSQVNNGYKIVEELKLLAFKKLQPEWRQRAVNQFLTEFEEIKAHLNSLPS